MHHGVAHFDPGRKAIKDEATGLGLEDGDEIGEVTKILVRAVNGCRELAFEGAGNLKQLIPDRVAHQERCGAKDLGGQV